MISILRSRGQETKEIVEEAVEEVIMKNRDALEELPQETIDTIRAIPELAGRLGVSGEELSTYVYNTIDPTDPRQKELANRLMDEVFTKIDNDYKLVSAKRAERAAEMAKQAEKQYNDVVKQVRGQMDLDFGDVLTSENFSTTQKLMNSAFDEKSIDKAAELIDDIMKTAKSRGFIKGPLLDKKNLIEFAADAQKQATASGQPVTKLEILGYLMDRVSKDAKNLRIDIEEFSKFTKQASEEIGEQLTRSEAQKIIKDRVDETVRRLSKDLPDIDPQKAPEQIQKIKESAEKIGEEVYDDAVQQTKKSGVAIAKGAFVTVLTMATSGALVAAYRAAKVPEPSKAPWYFDDDSVFSIVNGFMGRDQYQKLDKKVLNSPKAKQELLRIIFNPNNEKTNTFIEKLANINPQKIPVDELIPYSKELLKDFSELHKDDVLDSLERKVPVQQLYGTDNPEVISQKKEVMYRIISELFLFNENFDGKLVEYLRDVVDQKEKYTKQNRVIDLKKIFTGPSARSVSMGSFNDKQPRVKKHSNPVFDASSQGASSVADAAVREFNNWPTGKTENSDDTLEFLERYLKDSRAIGKSLSKDQVKNWVETNIRNPKKGRKPYAWSAVFLRSVTKQAGQELPSEKGMLASHKGYVEAAKKNTLKPGGPAPGEWFYLPMNKPLPALEDGELRDKGIGLQNPNFDYLPQNGDIIMTTGGRDSGYHGDILTSKGRIGGNVSDAIGVRSPNKPMHGIVTNNPKAREQLLNNLTAQGIKEMSKKDIKQLVAEVLNESYAKYPYNANEYSEEEPDQDYMVEWKALVEEVCGMKRKNIDGDPKTMEDAAVEVAKLFVKDSDLFREVLEMAGSNKSIGVEILQQLKAAREKKNLDKELNV